MMPFEPLLDFEGRTLTLGPDVNVTIGALLRFQNAKNHQNPITLYLIGSPSSIAPCATDALTICGLIRTLRSPVMTIGMGMLQPPQSLVLASGTHRRVLLKHSLAAIGPLNASGGSIARTPIGLSVSAQLRNGQNALEAQIQSLLSDLKLNSRLFDAERLLNAEEAVHCHLADAVIRKAMPLPELLKEEIYESQR